MASLDTLIQDLVIANRILAKEDVVDAYGHVSVRHPDNPKHFFISRSLAPELIEKTDIVGLGLDGAHADRSGADVGLSAAQCARLDAGEDAGRRDPLSLTGRDRCAKCRLQPLFDRDLARLGILGQ